ncbi:hypothetical protein [Christiangramia sp. LLG6405-1]|uniref:hypothetical protein n=1 Tax=Christiangramia sp. LLG6405-1 TaxID=3160832 RepID=UPI00386D4932
MRKTLKYFIPLVGLLYCAAVFEVEIVGNHHQTFGDEYDTYTKSNFRDFNSPSNSLKDYHFDMGIFPLALVSIETTFMEDLSATLKVNRYSKYFDKLFIKNCTWLI